MARPEDVGTEQTACAESAAAITTPSAVTADGGVSFREKQAPSGLSIIVFVPIYPDLFALNWTYPIFDFPKV